MRVRILAWCCVGLMLLGVVVAASQRRPPVRVASGTRDAAAAVDDLGPLELPPTTAAIAEAPALPDPAGRRLPAPRVRTRTTLTLPPPTVPPVVDDTVATVPAPPLPLPVPTTTAPRQPFVVSGPRGYWIGDAEAWTARWLMPVVNSGDTWSPDGTQVVYRSNPSEISIIDVRTGATRLLLRSDRSSLADPSWSPDGRHVAIHETQSGQPPALLVVDLDGDTVARHPDWVDGQQGQAWSPDGSRIAYASYNHESGEAWLSVVELGKAPSRLATGGSSTRFLGLRWSPRGTYLGWTFDEDLHLLRLATNEQRTFPLDGTPIYGHAWAPDESRLVVWGPQLFIMRPDGSELRLLDPSGHNASVDRTTGRIAWTRGYGVGRDRVVLSAPDGSGQEVILTTGPTAGIDGVAFSPAGRHFLFIQYGE